MRKLRTGACKATAFPPGRHTLTQAREWVPLGMGQPQCRWERQHASCTPIHTSMHRNRDRLNNSAWTRRLSLSGPGLPAADDQHTAVQAAPTPTHTTGPSGRSPWPARGGGELEHGASALTDRAAVARRAGLAAPQTEEVLPAALAVGASSVVAAADAVAAVAGGAVQLGVEVAFLRAPVAVTGCGPTHGARQGCGALGPASAPARDSRTG